MKSKDVFYEFLFSSVKILDTIYFTFIIIAQVLKARAVDAVVKKTDTILLTLCQLGYSKENRFDALPNAPGSGGQESYK
jgi:hypothetical protein